MFSVFHSPKPITSHTVLFLMNIQHCTLTTNLTGDRNNVFSNSFLLVRAECVRTNVVRALADVVAIKFGIILSFFFLRLTLRKQSPCAMGK